MKLTIALFTLIQVAVGQAAFGAEIERSEDISKSFRFADAGARNIIVVDNVFGSITVRGYDGDEVRVEAHKTIFASSDRKLARALEEVELEIYEDDDVIELFVDGPFRERRGKGINWRGHERVGYRVQYDFDIRVPKGCAVELQTVNDGNIVVESVEGDFEVSNVNGSIEMSGLRGAGRVYAVNGKVSLEFASNPADDCSFGTVNGDVRLYFRPGLSADFYMKTMNGDAYTDFEVTALPVRSRVSDSKNGKKVYKVGHMSGVRAGSGGPVIELNTLNGDMFILSR